MGNKSARFRQFAGEARGSRLSARATLAAALVAFVVLGAACGGSNAAPAQTVLATNESWCPDGFEVGPQDTCFAIPDAHDKNTPILVYLHGMYTGHGSAEEWSLVHSAVARGFAVVIPRGRRGACAWKAELKDHFCWPQEVDDPPSFKSVVQDWDRVLWQVDALLEGGTHKRYVLGFSNGGFFATYVAAHGLFPADGWAIINGGPLEPAPKLPKKSPMLLVSAQDDSDQGPKMKELHDSLAKAGWPHAFCSRPGPHSLASEDVEAALRFFKRDADGTLKANAGSYPCEGGTKPAP